MSYRAAPGGPSATARTVYVDLGSPTPVEDGTRDNPYKTIQAALDARPGTTTIEESEIPWVLLIASGFYPEDLTIPPTGIFALQAEGVVAIGNPFSMVGGNITYDAGANNLDEDSSLTFSRGGGAIFVFGIITITCPTGREVTLNAEGCQFVDINATGVVDSEALRYKWVDVQCNAFLAPQSSGELIRVETGGDNGTVTLERVERAEQSRFSGGGAVTIDSAEIFDDVLVQSGFTCTTTIQQMHRCTFQGTFTIGGIFKATACTFEAAYAETNGGAFFQDSVFLSTADWTLAPSHLVNCEFQENITFGSLPFGDGGGFTNCIFINSTRLFTGPAESLVMDTLSDQRFIESNWGLAGSATKLVHGSNPSVSFLTGTVVGGSDVALNIGGLTSSQIVVEAFYIKTITAGPDPKVIVDLFDNGLFTGGESRPIYGRTGFPIDVGGGFGAPGPQLQIDGVDFWMAVPYTDFDGTPRDGTLHIRIQNEDPNGGGAGDASYEIRIAYRVAQVEL